MSENFKNIIRELPPVFNTEEGHHIGKEFNSPCIIGSSLYQRQTGALTSNFLKVLTKETIDDLLKTEKDKCRIQFITHPKLEEVDKKALKDYLENKSQLEPFLEKLMDRSINEFINNSDYEIDKQSRLDIFTTLVAKKTIIIKFGFPKDPYKLFHKKTGIFHFDWGDKIGFIGGQNDTEGGLQNNIEILGTRQSWISEYDLKIINNLEQDFIRSWDNNSKNIETRPLTQKNLDRLEKAGDKFNKKSKSFSQVKTGTKNTTQEKIEENKKFNLWAHQKEAVDKFLLVKAGILEMATGTGKTKTSLEILKRLLDENKVNSCIITTNGNDLLGQWYTELLNFHSEIKNKIKKFFRYFGDNNTSNQFIDNPENSLLIISRDNLQKVLKFLDDSYKKNILIIHDEVHGFGSPSNILKLEGSHRDFIYKLGMSATPERQYGEDGNNFITNEIGSVFYKYRLEDAIKDNILCKMNYITQNYYLSDEERSEIKKMIASHHAKKKSGEKVKDTDLFTRIAGVRKNAESKISIFADYIKKNPEIIKNTIIFVYSKPRGRQISEILQGKVKYREYFDNDVSEHLDYFAKGDLDCLITCHRLSQGIDIKGLKNVILIASDRSRLESIQRIGRCLRKNPQDPNKIAVVFDLIDKDYEADIEREKWLNSIANIK